MTLESTVEKSLNRYVKRLKGTIVKISGVRDWPDRLVIPKGGIPFFVECKQASKKPRAGQKRNHAMLRALGQAVIVFDGTDWRAVYTLMRVRRKITVCVNKERQDADIRIKQKRTERSKGAMR